MKTLKEIQKNKHGTHINVFSPGCEERIYVDVIMLRAEAIRWVKQIKENQNKCTKQWKKDYLDKTKGSTFFGYCCDHKCWYYKNDDKHIDCNFIDCLCEMSGYNQFGVKWIIHFFGIKESEL